MAVVIYYLLIYYLDILRIVRCTAAPEINSHERKTQKKNLIIKTTENKNSAKEASKRPKLRPSAALPLAGVRRGWPTPANKVRLEAELNSTQAPPLFTARSTQAQRSTFWTVAALPP